MAEEVRHFQITETIQHGKRLGRHAHFDERSRLHRVTVPTSELQSKVWLRARGPWDQGDIGKCTIMGACGLLVTKPNWQGARAVRRITDKFTTKLYMDETANDPYPGQYPAQDTGSSVLDAMKALQRAGLITSYKWGFGVDDCLRTLSHVGPVEVGVNWYSGFDHPDPDGRVQVSGGVRGGHAFEILGIDVEHREVIAENSWGKSWGKKGRFRFSWDDLDSLLQEDGEVCMIT